ncbi:helix-turn-helix domain-containing protein [Qaidamihabitans albus]|uniref:helix-turn-helix domain-containing protein n=1 Tax=Qaidamihabitans albus TaxID=2795733 RepID=UPI0018F1E6EE|nr:helix-turn-helix domain-containing protein [Qaidamihabitans albus]
MGVPLRAWAVLTDGPGTRWSVYEEYPPGREVATVVARGWIGRAGWARALRILPDGCTDLLWDGHALVAVNATGPALRRWLPGTAVTVGLRLRRGVAGSLLGHAMTELPPEGVPLPELWGERARRAEDVLASGGDARRVLEQLVTERLRDGFAADPLAVAAAHALRSPAVRLPALVSRLGTSERNLRRRVRHEIGCGPKQLQRLLRFQRFHHGLDALASGRTSLAGLAAALGYADQSHLGRECLRLTGSSPARLVDGWARQGAMAETFQTGAAVPGTIGA